jgi:hypothetical protein
MVFRSPLPVESARRAAGHSARRSGRSGRSWWGCVTVAAAMICVVLCLDWVWHVAASSGVRTGPRRDPLSVAAIGRGLAHDPRAWVGQTVLIRGIALRCPMRGGLGEGLCVDARPVLLDQDRSAPPIPVDVPTPGRVQGFLQRLFGWDWLRSTVPALRWDRVATYRVRLQVGAGGSCPAPCYAAQLLNTVG